MPYDSKAVANRLLEHAFESGKPVTPLQLVKLAYISHGWYLAITGGDPLLRDAVEAWKYGPVVPGIYHAVKKFKAQPITEKIKDFVFEPGREMVFRAPSMPQSADAELASKVIDRVWEVYSHFSGPQLMQLTHAPGTPWYKVWYEGGAQDRKGVDIPDTLIREHFEQKAKDKSAATEG